MTPKEIKVENDSLVLYWQGGNKTTVKLSALRRYCPCAICQKEKSEHSEFYIPLYNDDQLKISNISAVGNYAIGVQWQDGHNSGIYEYDYLISLDNAGDS